MNSRSRLSFVLLLGSVVTAGLARRASAGDEPRAMASHPRAEAIERRVPDVPIEGVMGRVTYHGAIERIFQTRCQSCHHEGDIAPFPLMTYADAVEYRAKIDYMTQTRQMPPWHVDNACGSYADDPTLTDAELDAIARWMRAGTPEGDRAAAPAPLTFHGGWALGEPDAVLPMKEAFTPDFSDGDVYRCFVLPPNTSGDRWVDGVEVAPGNRAMVHHVLLFLDTTNESAALDAAEPGPGYTCFGGPGFTPGGALGGWAPGNRPALLPQGIGISYPAGSRVVMQVHYNPRAGLAAPDLTSVGLHFSRTPVKKQLYTVPLANTTFRLPAGEANAVVTANVPFLPVDVHLLGITPHMHLLGKTMEVTATAFDGTRTCLVNVPEWEFHWQGTYRYKEPIALRAGTRIDLRATYDNSASNPENPNSPPKDVTWGEKTTDEMCLAFLSFTLDSQ